MSPIQREAVQIIESAARLAQMAGDKAIVASAAHAATSAETVAALDRILEMAETIKAQSVERKAERAADIQAGKDAETS